MAAAAFKTGILGLGEGTGKKAVTETVKQAAGSGGQVPPYFLKLVSKIKTLGDETVATKDKTKLHINIKITQWKKILQAI